MVVGNLNSDTRCFTTYFSRLMIDVVHGLGNKLAHKLFKLVRSWLLNINVLHRMIILLSRKFI